MADIADLPAGVIVRVRVRVDGRSALGSGYAVVLGKMADSTGRVQVQLPENGVTLPILPAYLEVVEPPEAQAEEAQ